ncbi:MAG: carbohydrate ABC transporter permease [Clostridiaceae bacterium]|nr:carbohydrate ABC transporter permease [Clostridiaceae bacterium]
MKTKNKIVTACFHTFVVLLGIVMLYPIAWMVASSLKPSNEVFKNAASLIPSEFVWQNYADGWKGFGNVSFATFFKNSFVVTIIAVVGQVASSTFVAYGFTRIRFPGRKIMFAVMIVTMLLPAQILLIPQYIMFVGFDWINTYLPLIVPYFCGSAFFIFLIMQFIQGIPKELDESANIDGCGKFRTFFQIIVPLALPAIATTTVFSFYWKWDDFMGPLLYLQSPAKYTVSIALKCFADPSSVTNWGAMFAMSTLSLIPCFVIFLCFQRYLVEGISTTGLKG